MPQTMMWYSALMPLAVATTYREMCILSMASTFGFLTAAGVTTANLPNAGTIVWTVFVCSVYLPAAWIVIRKPGRGQAPQLMRGVVSLSRRAVDAEPSPVKVRIDP